MLRQERGYRVELLRAPRRDRAPGLAKRPDLIIPILHSFTGRAEQLLAAFQMAEADTPLLPVLGAGSLNERPEGLLLGATDFLVTPFGAVELLVRVRRFLTRPSEEPARPPERGADAVGLAQLVGDDPAFVAVKAEAPSRGQERGPRSPHW